MWQQARLQLVTPHAFSLGGRLFIACSDGQDQLDVSGDSIHACGSHSTQHGTQAVVCRTGANFPDLS